MQRYTALVLGTTAAIVVLGLAGCDSGSDSDANVGSLGIRMLWPNVQPANRERPPMVSLEVRILDVDLTPLSRADNPGNINRPAERVRFNNIPAGNYIVQAKAYCTPDEQSEILSAVEFPVVVVPNRHAEYCVTADGAVAGVNVAPNPIRLQAGETKRLIATAWNDAGIPLLVDPISAFEWTITEGPPSLTVDQDGRIAVPLWADVPILGKLLTSHRESEAHTEVLIFVTVRILEGPDG